MDTEQPHDDDAALEQAMKLGHEPTDVSVKGLFIFAGALVVSLVVIMGAFLGIMKGGQATVTRLDTRQSRLEPGAQSLVRQAAQFDGPLLQVTPEEDLKWMRLHQAVDLNSYGWADRSAGVVRLPVERAMELIAQRGLSPTGPNQTLESLQQQRANPQVWGQALRP